MGIKRQDAKSATAFFVIVLQPASRRDKYANLNRAVAFLAPWR